MIPNISPYQIHGFRVIIAQPVKCEVRRGFWNRIFSLTPHIATRVEFKEILKDDEIIQSEAGLHMTHKTWTKLKVNCK